MKAILKDSGEEVVLQIIDNEWCDVDGNPVERDAYFILFSQMDKEQRSYMLYKIEEATKELLPNDTEAAYILAGTGRFLITSTVEDDDALKCLLNAVLRSLNAGRN